MNLKNRLHQEYSVMLNILRNSFIPLSLGDIDAEINKSTEKSIHKKTIQRRLKGLIEEGLVQKEGKGRNQKYYVNKNNNSVLAYSNKDKVSSTIGAYDINEDKNHPIFSSNALSLLSYLETPSYGRIKTSYQVNLIESYVPNQTQYVPDMVRKQLFQLGKRFDQTLAAGTYAKHIGQRLLVDLSYHSSRLEGNTYSKLDTQNLIENGFTADGKIHEETVMIMNHKEAILFLIENADEIPLSTFTIRNIHYLLAQDLLKNPNACGRVREIEVKVGKSSYLPLNNPHQLTEHLALLLRKAAQIDDAFEQSFFLLIHISYLQAFEDVNKRTARLTCNIPFIKGNLCPLSFIDVPQEDYFKALLYFYEKNDFLPALELFQWAYIKSCEQYDVVKDSLGEIDSYRIQYRAERKEVIAKIIRSRIQSNKIEPTLTRYCNENNIASPDKFIIMVLQEIETLHSGALVSLGVTESVFEAWKISSLDGV